MTRHANIFKRGKLIATIAETGEGFVQFSYDNLWRTTESDSLSLTLPYAQHLQPTRQKSLPPFLDGLIPEGWLLTVAQRLQPDLAKDRFALLLATCGDAVGDVSVATEPSIKELSLPGAAAIPAAKERGANTTGRCLVCAGELGNGAHYHPKCAHDLFGTQDATLPFSQDEFEELARANINARLIVPGAQRKISTSLTRDAKGETGRLTIVGAGKDGLFIVKPQHPEAPTFPANEHLAMSLARTAGLPTAVFGLMVGPDGKFAYVTRRFDRVWTSKHNGITKLAMEDFGQLFNRIRDNDKYKGSYEQIGKFIRDHSPQALSNCAQLFDQVFLAYLIGNNDFHVRNISVFVESNKPLLTPVYDFTITQLIDKEPEIDTTLSVNGKKAKLKKEDWIAFGEKLGFAPKAVETKLQRIEKLMPNFNLVIKNSFLPDEQKLQLCAFMNSRMARVLN